MTNKAQDISNDIYEDVVSGKIEVDAALYALEKLMEHLDDSSSQAEHAIYEAQHARLISESTEVDEDDDGDEDSNADEY